MKAGIRRQLTHVDFFPVEKVANHRHLQLDRSARRGFAWRSDGVLAIHVHSVRLSIQSIAAAALTMQLKGCPSRESGKRSAGLG
jgi:hypothetical protein